MKEKLQELFEEFSDLLHKKDDLRVAFFRMKDYNDELLNWSFGHNDMRLFYAETYVYEPILKYLPNIRIEYWSDTRATLILNKDIVKDLEKAIDKLKQKSNKLPFEVGNKYKLLEDIELSVSIIARQGSIVEVTGYYPKSWGGDFLVIKPISGRYSVYGSENKSYRFEDLKESTSKILYDGYNGNLHKMINVNQIDQMNQTEKKKVKNKNKKRKIKCKKK